MKENVESSDRRTPPRHQQAFAVAAVYARACAGEDVRMETKRRRDYKRAWYLRNKAKVIARAVEWRQANLERARAIQRRYDLRRYDPQKRRAINRQQYLKRKRARYTAIVGQSDRVGGS